MFALLFPGQGSQEVGMGRGAFESSPAARAVFEEADAALDFPLSRYCFEGPEAELTRTEVQQPAVLTVSIALLRALEERRGAPLTPDFVLGHSLGEYTALTAVGALPLAEAVRLVNARGRYMQQAVLEGEGAMVAVIGAKPALVEEACAKAAAESGAVVSPANYNAPEQTVIAGAAAAVRLAAGYAQQAGARRTVELPVSAPFHCALMAPAAEKLAADLSRISFAPPRCPVLGNVEAAPYRETERIPALLEAQVTSPVRFSDGIKELVRLGVTHALEVGPGRVLSGLVRRAGRAIKCSGMSGMQDCETALEAYAAAPRAT